MCSPARSPIVPAYMCLWIPPLHVAANAITAQLAVAHCAVTTCCPLRIHISYQIEAVQIFSKHFDIGMLYRTTARPQMRCKPQTLRTLRTHALAWKLPGLWGRSLQPQPSCNMDPLRASHYGVAEAHDCCKARVEGPVGHQLCLHMCKHAMTAQPERLLKHPEACAKQHDLPKLPLKAFVVVPASLTLLAAYDSGLSTYSALQSD